MLSKKKIFAVLLIICTIALFGTSCGYQCYPFHSFCGEKPFSSPCSPHCPDNPCLPANPSIDVVKEIGCPGWDWFDANDPASAPAGITGGLWHYRITIKNTGDVRLEDIELEDDDEVYGIFDIPLSFDYLDPGQEEEVNYSGRVAISGGPYYNKATVTGYYAAVPYSDYDYAYYTAAP